MITPVSRVRTCIIGAGSSARKHIIGWQGVPDAHVVAIVDLDETRAAGLAEEFGIPTVSTSYTAMLKRADVNIVSLCTPTTWHGPIALAAANEHKHVFCERGITHTLDECDTLLTRAQRNRVAVGMSFPRRFQPSFLRIREMLDGDALGRPAIYRAHCLMPADDGSPCTRASKGMHVFLDRFADHYDSWSWLFRSEVAQVTARGFRWSAPQADGRKRLAAAPDTGVALIEFASGDLGVITTSCGMPQDYKPRVCVEDELIGPLGTFSRIQANQFIYRDQRGRENEVAFQAQPAYSQAIQEFASRIRRGEPPRVSGDDGRRALRIGLAICESMETGATVALR